MFRMLILWWGETNLIGQVFLVGSLGSYGDGGRGHFQVRFLDPCLEVSVCSSPVSKPRGGLDIFTYRVQRSIFWVLNFENLYFWGY